MAKHECEQFVMSLDAMYEAWRESFPMLAELSPELTVNMHVAFIMAIGMFAEHAQHILQHQDKEHIREWLLRAAKESRVFSQAVETTGMVEFGLGPAAAEAARLLVEEGRESVIRYVPQGDPRFTTVAAPSPTSARPKEEALKLFLQGWKPGGDEGGRA